MNISIKLLRTFLKLIYSLIFRFLVIAKIVYNKGNMFLDKEIKNTLEIMLHIVNFPQVIPHFALVQTLLIWLRPRLLSHIYLNLITESFSRRS